MFMFARRCSEIHRQESRSKEHQTEIVASVIWKATPQNGAGSLTFSPSNSKTPKVTFSPVVDTTGFPPLSYIITGRTEFAADSDSFKQNKGIITESAGLLNCV